MGRRGKRLKFGAAGGEFSQGEFTSPENFKNQWVPAGPSGPVGIGFSVVNVCDNGKIADLGLISHKYRYLLGKSRRFLFCRRMSLNLSSQEISPPAGGEFLSQRWERNQWPRPPSLAPSGQFTLRIAGGRLRMDTPCPYSPSLSPLAFGHLPLTRGVGPRSPITGDAYL